MLSTIIHKNQSGFLKGRHITDNLRSILDVVDYTNLNEIPGVLISIDFEKAFDKICYNSLYEIMRWFGFGPNFVACIKMLFTDFRLATINNGYLSPFITPQKGLFQGNPIASYLFILTIELLAIRLRQNPKIKGINIGIQEVLLSLFADDLAITMQYKQSSWNATVLEFERFQNLTGMKINYNKCTVYRLGSIRHTNAKFYSNNKLIWTDNPVSILRIYVTADKKELYNRNMLPIVEKAEAILKIWSYRNLSLFGKIQIINSLIISLFVYRLAVIPDPPQTYYEKLELLIKKIIWNGKRSKIKLSQLYGLKDQGGAGLTDIKTKNQAIKKSWAEKALRKFEASMKYTSFWISVLRSHVSDNFEMVIEPEKICKQLLWYNSEITINGEPVYFQNWHEKGIKFFYQIWNYENKELKTHDKISREFNFSCPFTEYYGLIYSIPRMWISCMKNDPKTPYEQSEVPGSRTLKCIYRSILWNESLLLEKYNCWAKEIPNLEYDDFVRKNFEITKLTISVKLRSFQYRILSRALVTNVHLFHYRIRSDKKCSFCELEDETVYHLFYDSKYVQLIWKEMSKICKVNEIGFEEIILNQVVPNMRKVENCIVLIIKYYIYQKRCLKQQISVQGCKSFILEYQTIEKQIAFQKRKITSHNQKWENVKI